MRRGYVRPEDELPLEPDPEMDGIEGGDDSEPESSMPVRAEPETIAAGADPAAEPEEDEGLKPLPERLVAELTVHRTLALRQALGERPDVALLAALHALCLKLFYPYGLDTCLELELRQVAFGAQVRGLGETAAAKALEARHQAWAALLPRGPADLWAALSAMDEDTRRRLFAHCVGGAVNAVQETWNRRPRALAHAGQLAAAVGPADSGGPGFLTAEAEVSDAAPSATAWPAAE